MGGVYGNQEKLQDLLDRLNLQERSYSNDTDDFEKRMLANIDYDSTFNMILDERNHTIDYLKDILK